MLFAFFFQHQTMWVKGRWGQLCAGTKQELRLFLNEKNNRILANGLISLNQARITNH